MGKMGRAGRLAVITGIGLALLAIFFVFVGMLQDAGAAAPAPVAPSVGPDGVSVRVDGCPAPSGWEPVQTALVGALVGLLGLIGWAIQIARPIIQVKLESMLKERIESAIQTGNALYEDSRDAAAYVERTVPEALRKMHVDPANLPDIVKGKKKVNAAAPRRAAAK